MKKITELFSKHKKSILSLVLAILLTISFNCSPISLFASMISSAYKAESKSTYYSASSTGEESKISKGQYPSNLDKYFEGSSNNFNIKTSFYDPEFESTFGYYVHEYLAHYSESSYTTAYNNFLTNKGYNTADDGIYSYYTANKSNISQSTFRDYVEYFVSNTQTIQVSGGDPIVIPAIFDNTDTQYKSKFYCALANYMDSSHQSSVTDNDGIENADDDFYEKSISYNRVKTLIDNDLEKVLAIYGYDGKTQSKYVASILANGAPVSVESYYSSSYETTTLPDVTYETDTTTKRTKVYTFGNDNSVSTDFKNSTEYYYQNETEMSTRDNSLLYYIPIQEGQTGYNADFPTYYHCASTSKTPYVTNLGITQVYVLSDSPSENQKATYEALGFKIISSTELSSARNLYINVPYYSNDTAYFEKIMNSNINTVLGNNSQKFFDMFAPEISSVKTSILYFKFAATTGRNIYYDSANVGINIAGSTSYNETSLKAGYKYNYLLQNSVSGIASNADYELITSGTYYDSNYNLYFKKTKVYYDETTTNTYGTEYELKSVPNIKYETHEVPSEYYELDTSNKKVIYALGASSSLSLNGTTCEPLSQETLDDAIANLYIKVPASVSEALNNGQAETYEFYYKHKTVKANKIYVLDDKNTNPDVYKNLHYTVITNADYLSSDTTKNYSNYNIITESDANYNKNMKLYYKYNITNQSDIFVQNELTDMNARFIVDNSVDETELALYTSKGFTVITQTEFDSHPEFYKQIDENDTSYYDPQNTALYFKYKVDTTASTQKQVYLYSTSTSSTYATFSSSDTDYDAKAYELIKPDDANYVEGTDLYYKKIKTGSSTSHSPIKTYYYYETNVSGTSAKLEKNSYYAISFYVYTNGYYDTNDVTTTGSLPIETSVYLSDSNNIMDEISIVGIKTEGTWKQYFMFIATNELSDSSYKLQFYMGSKDGLLGTNSSSTSITSVTGNILFDNIQIYKINETDYNKQSINENLVQDPDQPLKDGTGESASVISGKYADEFNNEVIIINNDTLLSASNKFDARVKTNVTLFNDNMFNFDSQSSAFSSLSMDDSFDGYSPISENWSYYISRENSEPGNTSLLNKYREAYKQNKLTASIVDEESFYDDKVKSYEDAHKDDDSDDDDDEVYHIKSTFENDNKVLKLENSDTFLTLGVTSNTFTIKQFQYYKVTVWIYSTDEDAEATITVNSVYKTLATPSYGTLMTSSGTVKANINDYTTTPTNEYGWIPVSFYIAGNSLHDQDCTLVLEVSENSTIYFDRITITNTTSDAYKTVTSDSDTTTYYLSLTDSSSVLANGITNGYFNDVNVTTDYAEYDYTLPKTVKNWTLVSSNSSNVVAGAIPTNSNYTSLPNNFFTKYNGGTTVSTNYGTNIFAINAPDKKTDSVTGNEYNTTSTFRFYSSSTSLSASKVYKIQAEFYYTNSKFEGTVLANLYSGSVATDKLLTSISVSASDLVPDQWNTLTIYISTSSQISVYFELGIENAVGTCFFQKAIKVEESKTLNAIRDELYESVDFDDNNQTEVPVNSLLKTTKFINMNEVDSSLISSTPNKNGLYNTNEYKTELETTSTYTVGKTGVAVASYYTSSEEYSYTVTINKVEYYLAPAVDENGDFVLDANNNKVYKLYSDSNYKEEVTEIDGKTVTVNGTKSVTLGSGKSATDTSTAETKKTNYVYSFDKDVEFNNVFISKDELQNAQSQNVLILANSYSTDYSLQVPVYTNSLSTSAYYVLKIYVKTSAFESDDFGLNIEVSSISTSWTNIDTTKISSDNVQKDSYGFVCYQVLITTNTSSIASLAVNFSLGTEKSTGTGYAIISKVEVENFATEKLFTEYTESEKVSDDESVMKKFFGTVKSEDETTTDETKEDEKMSWATFFYIFSSLLLVIALVIALVSIILKKHPIKVVEQIQNDHERNSSPATNAKRNSNNVIEITDEDTKSKSVKKLKSKSTKSTEKAEKVKEEDDDITNPDGGFI